MKPGDHLYWAASLIATLAASEFYGEVTIQFQQGKISVARIEQTLKPDTSAYKQMTAQQYRLHQELQRLTEGKHGQEGT